MMKPNNFTSDFFTNNRNNLKRLLGDSMPIVLVANGLLQSSGDTTYPFCQDASFWYLTGCDEPDVVLVCDHDFDYLIIPNRERSRETFDGTINLSQLKAISGIDTAFNYSVGWDHLRDSLSQGKQFASLLADSAYIKQLGMYTNPSRAKLIKKLKSLDHQLEIRDIKKEIAQLRVIKQPVEIKALQTAVDITIDSLNRIFGLAREGQFKYEFEIEAELSRDFRRLGASGHAFSPIVAGGERACVLHNIKNDGPINSTELLLCDVGAYYNHYSADISRTISLKKPTKRQSQIYNIVLETQLFALSLLRPGIILKSYELEVEQFLAKKLRQLGLLQNRDSARQLMPHATSHFLGINAHDIGLYDQPLAVGMVLTVEPGLYLLDESIGVRIEDDVVITSGGCQPLSDRLSRSLT